jgi:hypothetical protein
MALPTATDRAVHVAAMHHGHSSNVTPARWSWIEGTYWYVPTANLPATIFNPSSGALVPILDQTVYHVTGYRNGYFWGPTVSQFGSSTPSGSSLVGSVTPEGRVLLSFTASSGDTQGFGSMTRKHGQWTMENQMFTSSSGTLVGHWAYMVQTRPGMKSWKSLPSAGVSVPTFLANDTQPPPDPVF